MNKKFPTGAEYTLCARQWQRQLSYKDDDGVFGDGEDFSRIFKAAYDYEPPYQAAESAAAVQVWADVFKRAQSFDTAVLRDTIAATKMQTFYGNIRFNEAGQNIAKPMVMSQIWEAIIKLSHRQNGLPLKPSYRARNGVSGKRSEYRMGYPSGVTARVNVRH